MPAEYEQYEKISMREHAREKLADQHGPIAMALSKVKFKIAVMSGKGGVGKTSVTINLASVLKKMGYTVGIFDADVHGPSVPKMIGVDTRAELHGAYGMKPVETADGIKIMSVSLFWPGEATPVMWKGQYKSRVLRELLATVQWGEIDFLLIDLPPGTGDEPITIMKSIPNLDGVLMVTSPQEVSVAVCSKAISSANELEVPVLGLIENMSGFCCPHCGQVIDIMGQGRGADLARTYQIPFLGRVPLDAQAGKAADEGVPVVAKYPEAPAAVALKSCTEKMLDVLKSKESK